MGIREVTDKRISHLIYSHEHWDHIGGSNQFPADVEIVAHRMTAELLHSRNDNSRRLPTTVYDQAMTIGKAERRLELSYKGIDHSIDNTFIYAPHQKTLMLIDVIYPGRMPYKNLGVALDMPGFVDAIARCWATISRCLLPVMYRSRHASGCHPKWSS